MDLNIRRSPIIEALRPAYFALADTMALGLRPSNDQDDERIDLQSRPER